MTQAVGMIVDEQQAEEILAADDADLIAIGREALFDPFRAGHAAYALGADPGVSLLESPQRGHLAKRAPGLARQLTARAAARETMRDTG
ncbi:hypothetical protein JQK88_34450 [Mesorhizobium caraganae]|uniref:oxidoreductase n=1 Tax=Mesorhizobium caraganae TaxID=483206 RepID=UPI001939E0DF|nr:hypothetical protein [Mesorhizobium caraganae]MBM2716174.1 hypothetical protein [Mesorhizobium caraganae]